MATEREKDRAEARRCLSAASEAAHVDGNYEKAAYWLARANVLALLALDDE